MNGAGRPSKYSKKLADEICHRIADGKSLRKICEDESMPHRDTVRKWLGEREEFSAQYARAREDQAEHYADEIIEIADSSGGDVALGRLKIDARKWVASKLAPKKYGDKLDLGGKMDFDLKIGLADRIKAGKERVKNAG